MDVNANSFLGRGWKFPVQVDKKTGRIMMSDYEDDIKEAIKIILLTYKGERIMLPDFGSRIFDYVFDSDDDTTLNLLKEDINDALIRWEPRIQDIEVNVERDMKRDGVLLININYIVRSTNNPFNLVYPFFINEGMID